MSEHHTISLNLLGKFYKVKCPQDKVSELREAAEYLETKIKQSGNPHQPANIDRLIMIAALNIAHELMDQKKQTHHYVDAMNQRLIGLQQKIEQATKHIESD